MATGAERDRIRVTVVIPWWNHPELIHTCGTTLIGEYADEVLIMDNASDPSVAYDLNTILGGQYGCTVIHRDENSQLHALTQGMQTARNDKIVFLNNDVIKLSGGWLSKLAEAIQPGVFIGPQLRTALGIEYIDGWCMGFYRPDFERIGGYDFEFEEPAYWADVEICHRAVAQGIVLRQVDLPLRHIGSVSSRPLQRFDAFWETFNRNQQRLMERIGGGLGIDVVEQA